MKLNNSGLMVNKWWNELENKFRMIDIDEYIIMPNHMHGIISIVGADLCVCPSEKFETQQGAHIGAPLHRVIQWFKTMTTNEYVRNVYTYGWERFNRKLWQRNYFERIIRNEKELMKIREYIRNNPMLWDTDEENPVNL
jgi:putative transposase